MHFLGIDIGTSAVKAVIVDVEQTVVARSSVAVATRLPRPGWFEQDPEDWWDATEHAVAAVREQAPAALADVVAVGLSGQMHGLVVLDAGCRVIRPAILWNDSRAASESETLNTAVPEVAEIAGVVAMPGFTAPKLMWLRTHERDNFNRIHHVMLAKDYVRFRLTGEIATDASDAAGSLLLDEPARTWSDTMLAAIGVARAHMPRLLEGSAISGSVRGDVAAAWGLKPAAIVAAGAGDSAAGAVGIGAIAEGDSFAALGTSAQIFVARDRYAARPPANLVHCFAHALPNRWFEQAALLNGAACLEWIARLLDEPNIGSLLAQVEQAFKGPSPVLFLPYLAGERTPLNDPEARGVFAGLEYATSPLDLVQAVLEGVAFSLVDGCEALGEGRRDPLPLIGGGARSLFWMKLIASALGRPLLRVAGADTGPAFGAARLARLALTGELSTAVCSKPAVSQVVEPDRALEAGFAARLPVFRQLYRSLKRARGSTADRRPAAIQ